MPLEHSLPSSATVKQLYGRAFRCAYPGCSQPLYREDEVTGEWTLNSRICHISARRERGPRWDASQSADDNRSFENLVLMCLEHASAIDDPRSLDSYPGPLLREWKKAQIDDHHRQGSGWPLTTAMADHALAASSGEGHIEIRNSSLNLGGEGGKAPGAGGGGGGAIGAGSRGGTAGRGGDRYYIGPETAISDGAQFDTGDNAHSAGSGGAGSGAVGPGALGGSGGDGGDGVVAHLSVEPGDVFQMDIGEGGTGNRLPGQHPIPGGDTVVRHLSADGKLKRLIRVRGGAAARAGDLPDGVTALSEDDLLGGFHVSTLMPVDAAEFRANVFTISGGNWASCPVPTLPIDTVWQVAVAAHWRVLEGSSPRGMQLCLLDPQGDETARVTLEIPATELSGVNRLWIVPIGAHLTSEGLWTLRVQSGKFLLSEVQIGVALQR